MNYIINISGILLKILEDDGFKLSTSEAILARSTAIKIVYYTTKTENQIPVQLFNEYLSRTWMTGPPTTTKIREEVWARFSAFTSSDDYCTLWKSLYGLAGIECCPIVAFHLTLHYFMHHWKKKYPIADKQTEQLQSKQQL